MTSTQIRIRPHQTDATKELYPQLPTADAARLLLDMAIQAERERRAMVPKEASP
jgi:hypothetical protein